MSTKLKVRLALAAIVAVVAVFFVCPFNREKAIASLLSKSADYIQEKNLKKLMRLFSPFYKDGLGMTFNSLGGGFDYTFKQYQNIRIVFTIRSIVCGKDTCIAHTLLWAHAELAGRDKDLAGKEDDPEPLDVHCVREMLKWKIIGSRWTRHTPAIMDIY